MNQLLGLAPGTAIGSGGRRYVITHILSLEAILAKDQETGRSIELKLCDITPPTELSAPEKTAVKDLALIEQKDWTTAELWFSRIYPLLSGRRTDEMVRAVAQEAGVHRTTVYRKLARYEQTSRVSELTLTKPTGGKGQSRLAPEAEAIVDSLLKEVYLNRQKRSIKKGGQTPAPELNQFLSHHIIKRARRAGLFEAKEKQHLGLCRHCQATQRQIKSGFSRHGTQQFRCGECGRIYQEDYVSGRIRNVQLYSEASKRKAVEFHLSGKSFREIGRLLSIQPRTARTWCATSD